MNAKTTTAEQPGDPIVATELCPACGQKGRKVKRVTLESLLRPERRTAIAEGQYHVCTAPGCEVVYFGPDGGATFAKSDLTVRFGLKESGPPRPVCYCFDHDIEGIHDEIVRTGESTVVDSIKADLQGAGCRCEYTNPLGICCLSSVQPVVAEGFRKVGREATAEASRAAQEDCCAAEKQSAPVRGAADCCAMKDESSSASTE